MKKPSRHERTAQHTESRELFDEWVAQDPRWATIGQMTDEEFQSFLGEWVVRQPVDEAFSSEVKRVVATQHAMAHLEAYRIDRNPDHIFNAVQEYLRLKVPLPDVMQRNLGRGLDERHKKPTGNPRKNTLRDVWILTAIGQRYGGKIPEQIDGDLITALARQHHVSRAIIKNVISRLRKVIADPLRYERARAFR